jgi:hypothetical protein
MRGGQFSPATVHDTKPRGSTHGQTQMEKIRSGAENLDFFPDDSRTLAACSPEKR